MVRVAGFGGTLLRFLAFDLVFGKGCRLVVFFGLVGVKSGMISELKCIGPDEFLLALGFGPVVTGSEGLGSENRFEEESESEKGEVFIRFLLRFFGLTGTRMRKGSGGTGRCCCSLLFNAC